MSVNRRASRRNLLPISVALASIICQAVLGGSADYWNTQRKGANFFPNDPRPERFKDAVDAGILLGRLACNKWLNGRPEAQLGDFLLGPKETYAGIVEDDVKYLRHVLDDADKAGMKIVLTMLSLPGSRWLQHNRVNGKCAQQYDLWRDFKYHQQAASFWRDLAKALRNHPAIVGYNLINEPCPERANQRPFRDWYTMDYRKWYRTVQGTPADLNLFYKTVIEAIREVDPETPIVLDSGFYANPYAFQILDPRYLGDGNIVYSFHQYEPSSFLSGRQKEKYKYPGPVPTGELDAAGDEDAQPPYAPIEYWDRKKLSSYFRVITDWMTQYRVPNNRIYAGEFGGDRQAEGVEDYFRDLISFFNANGWHWSFYAYREDDGFPKMDYELGTGELPKTYWKCSQNYTCKSAGIYQPNPLWAVIQNGLK